jgi:hypothetical protein
MGFAKTTSKPWKAPDNNFDGTFTQHVIRACYYTDAIFIIDECFRRLKPGAWLRILVPDLDKFINYKAFKENCPGMFVCWPKAISSMTQFQIPWSKLTLGFETYDPGVDSAPVRKCS